MTFRVSRHVDAETTPTNGDRTHKVDKETTQTRETIQGAMGHTSVASKYSPVLMPGGGARDEPGAPTHQGREHGRGASTPGPSTTLSHLPA